MKLSKILTFVLLVLSAYQTNGFEMDNATANFITELRKADSVSLYLSQQTVFKNESDASVDTLLRNVLNSNSQIYAVLRINRNGKVVNDINRDFITNNSGNVKNKDWFKTPIKDGSVFIGGVLTANSRKCFLKTYPLIDNEKHSFNYGVLAILIDLKYCLGELPQKVSQFTLFYDKAIVFQSETPSPFSRISIPEFGKLELMYMSKESADHFSSDNHMNNIKSTDNKSPLTLYLPWALALLTVVISLYFVLASKPRVKKEELVELEYHKLSDETHKLIHDRAISQLYCEVKRQLETHELNKIQQEVRQKLAADIESKKDETNKAIFES